MIGTPIRLGEVARSTIWLAGDAVCFQAGLQIDCDGAPNAYHPPTPEHPQTGRPPGLDALGNAGTPAIYRTPTGEQFPWYGLGERPQLPVLRAANWYGIATVDGASAGAPAIQGADDPCPGFYISQTALQDTKRKRLDPHRYVDAALVPYIVLPGRMSRGGPSFSTMTGTLLGDLAVVCYQGQLAGAIFADVGPSDHIGEGSLALARELGMPASPDAGHDEADVAYVVFPGSASRPAWPRTAADVRSAALALFQSWGGMERLREGHL